MGNKMQSLNERIAERVGENLVDLIPDDQWQALVDEEVRKFRTVKAPQIIQEVLTETYKTQAKAEILKLIDTDEWSEITGNMTSSKLKAFITECGGQIFAGVLTPAMGMVLQDLHSRLNNGY